MGSNAEYELGKLMAKNEEANARIAELTAEVASLRNTLISIKHEVRFSVDPITDHIATIARNALKEGV